MTWTTRPRSDVGGQPAIVAGAGAPVLLLHGVGLRAEAWGAQIDALSGLACVIAPDMPGHGENPMAGDRFQWNDYVNSALAVLGAVDGPAVVVGHSMGALLSLELAVRAQGKVRSVAALNAVFERGGEAARAVQSRAAALSETETADPGVTLHRWFADSPSAERDACQQWLTSVDPKGYKSAYTAFAHSTVPDRAMLSRILCPALFMTGAEEPNSTPAMSDAMAQITPNGRRLIVEGAAHMMPMTHADPVNAAVLRLMAGQSPSAQKGAL